MKVTFGVFVGIQDEVEISQIKIFSDHLQGLENGTPLHNNCKSKYVVVDPFCVMHRSRCESAPFLGWETLSWNVKDDFVPP